MSYEEACFYFYECTTSPSGLRWKNSTGVKNRSGIGVHKFALEAFGEYAVLNAIEDD